MQRGKRKPRKRKAKVIDPIKAEETARRVASIEARRQKVINEVKLSLEKRRREKLEVENARLEKEARARVKGVRDAEKSRGERTMLQIRGDLSRIVEAGIKCVYTSAIIREKIKYDGRSTMSVKGTKYKLKNNLHIVGWGKEAITMSSALEKVVGKELKRGWMVVPRKSIFMMWSFPEAFPRLDTRITYLEAGRDGQPDERSVEANRRILHYCKRLKKRDLLIVMLSGGIDDLLCCPRDAITLKDKLRVLNRLQEANATAEEIDIVRNKLSAIRGGDLARTAYPARVVLLFTSDVSSNPPDLLGGGPCTYDPKNTTALDILTKYRLSDRLPQSIRELVSETVPWKMSADDQLDTQHRYKFVHRHVIACNRDAMECMSTEAFRLGLFPVKLSSTCTGGVRQFGQEYAKIASLMILAVEGKLDKLDMYQAMKDSPVCPLTDKQVQEIFPSRDTWGLGLCLLLGGRASVDLVTAPGTGGPNQELALYFSLYWYMRTEQYPILKGYTVWFLGGSSRGRDGNSDAAGAFGYKSLATDVYPEYEKANSAFKSAHLRWWRLAEDKQSEAEIALAHQDMKNLESTYEKHASILPGRVLKDHNTHLLFSSINDGDELLELTSGNYYTFTDVGDLHAIRIARFQCNCDGGCHRAEDRICADRECHVNRTLSTGVQQKLQYCCRVGAPRR